MGAQMTKQLDMLSKVTTAVFNAKLSELQKIQAEESALRDELRSIEEELFEKTRASQTDLALRSLGADILWQSWVGRKRAELQRQLALVMVRKAAAVAEIRTAFGKKDVVERLVEKADFERRIDKKRRSI